MYGVLDELLGRKLTVKELRKRLKSFKDDTVLATLIEVDGSVLLGTHDGYDGLSSIIYAFTAEVER